MSMILIKGKCHFELHYQDYCISYTIGNYLLSMEASAIALLANQTRELAGIYGKLSSTHGNITKVLIIFRNST